MKTLYLVLGMLAVAVSVSQAQPASFSQSNLVSNVSGVASNTDSQLKNPWGISFLQDQDFWIADNNSGFSTVYDPEGHKDTSLIITIPGAAHNPNGNCSPGCPTGTVSNANGAFFSGGQFIFDTEDGLIANWTGVSNTASIAFDNSASGAVYKGLALLNGSFLLAANFNSGKVDVLDHNFNPTSLSGPFTDPHLPAGLAPHNIRVIGNQVYVAYAMQDGGKHDAQPGAGLGQVDIFDMNGNFVSTFVASGSKLNAPWGVTAAPATFGAFPNAILIGNFGDGTINAFDTTGKFLGQLSDSSGKTLVNPGLWDMVFGGGASSGDTGTLYITAGGNNQPNFPSGGTTTAVFAAIVPAAVVSGPNFSLNFSSQSATLAQGGSTNLTISAASVGGFNGQINLSCSAPAGLTCAFNPSSISPGSSISSSMLTISASAMPPANGYVMRAMALLPGLGLFGTVLVTGKRKSLNRKKALATAILGLVLLLSLFAVACGGGNNNKPAPTAQVNLMVTGTSGSISHSSAVAVTIN